MFSNKPPSKTPPSAPASPTKAPYVEKADSVIRRRLQELQGESLFLANPLLASGDLVFWHDGVTPDNVSCQYLMLRPPGSDDSSMSVNAASDEEEDVKDEENAGVGLGSEARRSGTASVEGSDASEKATKGDDFVKLEKPSRVRVPSPTFSFLEPTYENALLIAVGQLSDEAYFLTSRGNYNSRFDNRESGSFPKVKVTCILKAPNYALPEGSFRELHQNYYNVVSRLMEMAPGVRDERGGFWTPPGFSPADAGIRLAFNLYTKIDDCAIIDDREGYNMKTWWMGEKSPYPGDEFEALHKDLTRQDTHYIVLPEIVHYKTNQQIAPWDWSKLKKATVVAYFQPEHTKLSSKSAFTPRLIKLEVLKTVGIGPSPMASGSGGSGKAGGSGGHPSPTKKHKTK